MKILIDIGHPAHVHLFKHFAWQMKRKGHKILFTVRDKEFEVYLLDTYGFNYRLLGKHYTTKIGKILGLLQFDVKMFLTALSFKPDVFLSHGSLYAAHVAGLLNKPHISVEDTGNMEQVHLYLPFTKVVLTSTAFHRDLGKKQIRYDGYHELAYLHPNRFSPDKSIRNALGIDTNIHFSLLRFVSWHASHDYNQKGLTDNNKTELVKILTKFGKVFISSEGELAEDIKKYEISLPPENMHDVLAEADLFIGEGATMASECAMIGTPAIYINTLEAGTIDEQEKYGLLFHFRNFEGVVDKATEILSISKKEFKVKRDKMLRAKIDVTAFLIWFVEYYPSSKRIMKENPAYQKSFM